MLDDESQVLSWRKGLQAKNIDLVVGLYLVVIRRINESQCKHALLLQICLVDTGKRADNDSQSTKIAWFQSSVLTRGTLAIVGIT